MLVLIPADAVAQSATVQIGTGQEAPEFGNGTLVLVPAGVEDAKYKVTVNGKKGALTNFATGTILDTTDAFGTLVFSNIPESGSKSTTVPFVEFTKLKDVHLDKDNGKVVLPVGFSIQWRPSVNGYVTAWTEHTVAGGTLILDISGYFCKVTVTCVESERDLTNVISSCTNAALDFLPLIKAPLGVAVNDTVVLLAGVDVEFKIPNTNMRFPFNPSDAGCPIDGKLDLTA